MCVYAGIAVSASHGACQQELGRCKECKLLQSDGTDHAGFGDHVAHSPFEMEGFGLTRPVCSKQIGRNGSGQAVLSAPRLGLWAGLRGAGATGALRGLVLQGREKRWV